jgi:hypothetical protein
MDAPTGYEHAAMCFALRDANEAGAAVQTKVMNDRSPRHDANGGQNQ